MHKDNYGLTVTCVSDRAFAAFQSGIACALSLDNPGINELTLAVQEDPNFALAHAALARQLLIHGFIEKSASHSVKAETLSPGVNRREQGAIQVILAAVRFQADALSLAQAHVQQTPRDVFVLSHLLGPFGLLAFSGQRDWREQNIVLLKQIQNDYSTDDWWHKTTFGFMAAETGDLVKARRLGENAWQIQENGSCAHTLAHVHFEQGAVEEGRQFIQDWCLAYGGHSDMRHHLIWHLALLSLETGDQETLLDVYKEELDAELCDPMPLSTLSDNASLLWRCVLNNLVVPARTSRNVMDYAQQKYPQVGFPFADVHRSMMTALQSKQEQREWLDQLNQLDSETGQSVTEFTKGFSAFVDGDYQKVITILERVLDNSVLLGGSNPQRRIVEETYMEACIRKQRFDPVRRLLQERQRMRASPADDILLKRIQHEKTKP